MTGKVKAELWDERDEAIERADADWEAYGARPVRNPYSWSEQSYKAFEWANRRIRRMFDREEF